MSIFNFLFQKKGNSKDIAKNRLQVAIINDKKALYTSKILDPIKKDILEIINKYAEVDYEKSQITIATMSISDNKSIPALYAHIPIKSVKE